MKCYQKLGRTEDAISVFLPYALDSLSPYNEQYRDYVNHYYKVLRTRFSKGELKKQFENGVKGLHWQEVYKMDSTIKTVYKLARIEVRFDFLSHNVGITDEVSWSVLQPDQRIPEEIVLLYTREFYQEMLRRSILYQLILDEHLIP